MPGTENSKLEEEIKSAIVKGYKYYCYGLIDPRDEQMFYVGKGTKNRVFMHNGKGDDNKIKNSRINEILYAGKEIKRTLLSFHQLESEAYETESALIACNKENLTNIVHIPSNYHKMSLSEWADYYLNKLVPFNLWVKMKIRTEEEVELYDTVVNVLFQYL